METCRATPLFSPPQAFEGRNKGTSQKQTSSLLKLTSRVPRLPGWIYSDGRRAMGESERQIKIGRKARWKGWGRKGEDRRKEKGRV